MERKIRRWERHVEPDGYDSIQLGRLEVTLIEPEHGEGWNEVTVDVSKVITSYISRKSW